MELRRTLARTLEGTALASARRRADEDLDAVAVAARRMGFTVVGC